MTLMLSRATLRQGVRILAAQVSAGSEKTTICSPAGVSMGTRAQGTQGGDRLV